MSGDYFLVGSYLFVPDRQEYYGTVCKQQGKALTVLTVGCETSEAAILTWIKDTIALMRASGQENVQAPDMYDRARRNLQ